MARGGKGVDTESRVGIGKIREERVEVPFVSDALLEDVGLFRSMIERIELSWDPRHIHYFSPPLGRFLEGVIIEL